MPVKSKNTQAKDGLKIKSISLSKVREIPYVNTNTTSGQGWINYDVDDLYPQRILNYTKSSVHNAILNLKRDYIIGDGLAFEENPLIQEFFDNINDEYDVNELLKRTALDLVMFGGYAWQVIWNIAGDKILGIKHVPFAMVRKGTPNEFGRVEKYYLVNKNIYGITQNNNVVELPAFDPRNPSLDSPSIYYHYEYSPLISYYPIPDYFGALTYIDLDIQISDFHNSNVRNGFTPTGILAFPDDPTDEEKEKRYEEIRKYYGGVQNAGSLLVMFGSMTADMQVHMPQFTPISNNNNADIYSTIDGIATQKIISGHRLNSPTLAGLAGTGGLGGNASELATASDFFYNTVIKGYQNRLLSSIKYFLKLNNISQEVNFANSLPVKFIWSETTLNSILSINEMRIATGYEPLEGGQYDAVGGYAQKEDVIEDAGDTVAVDPLINTQPENTQVL